MYRLLLGTLLTSSFTVLAHLRGLTTLTYDNAYDDASLSLDSVACSGGANGLETKGYTTLGSLPTFPFLGGGFPVTGWNSTECGSCFAITYHDTTINVLLVDKTSIGFSVSEAAMNDLTGNNAVAYGVVTVDYLQLPPSSCGLN